MTRIVSNRSYNSTRRKDQARQTRQLITEAARKIFLERGYSGATIEAIAAEAGVAVETVYAAFGSKKNLLLHLMQVSVVGDDEAVPLLERDEIRAVAELVDPRDQIRLFSGQIYEIMTRVAPLFGLMSAAAMSEPEIAELRSRMLGERLGGMRHFIGVLSARQPLRTGLDPELAAETAWALTSAEVFTLLTVTRGWSGDAYQAWLREALERLLLMP